MQKKDNSKPSMNKNERKRGRPAGKNRVPLSLHERRARNAQYERERRIETADATAQLAEAACCEPQITTSDLLATVINRLQNVQAEKSLDDLRRINKDLESQIAALEKRLAGDSSGNSDVEKRSEKREAPQFDSDTDRSIEKRRPAKFRKISKKSKVHDESRPISRISSRESSTDSHCSNHHLKKTLPSRIEPLSPQMEQPIIITKLERTPPPYLQETEPRTDVDSVSHSEMSSKSVCKIAYEESSSDDEVYSQNSKELGIFRVQDHQDVKVEFQFLSQNTSIKSKNRTGEHADPDPFTDQEKAILSKLGWGDYSFDGSYSENQPCWSLMDYSRY